MDHYAETDRLLRSEFDSRPDRYDGDEHCVDFEPALKPGLAGGWYYHDPTPTSGRTS